MADDVDRASELEQVRIENSLGAIAKQMMDFSSSIECIECGEEIEEERRRILPSAKRCFICQEKHERPLRVRRF